MIARALGAALVASIVAFGVQTWRLDSARDELHEQERIAAAELIAAEQRARAKEQEYAANARKAGEIYATQSARVRADASGALSELERLRDALGSGDVHATEGAASAARTDDAARARAVVAECAGALQALAANLDDTEARLVALQRYVAGITKD